MLRIYHWPKVKPVNLNEYKNETVRELILQHSNSNQYLSLVDEDLAIEQGAMFKVLRDQTNKMAEEKKAKEIQDR